MSTRTSLRPNAVIAAGDMSGDLTSEPTVLQSLSKVSYAASWSGTSPVGTLSIEASNDYAIGPDGNVANAGTWNTLTISYAGSATTSVPISGNTGSQFIDILDTAAYAMRAVYTRASGVGSLTVTVAGKVS